MKSDLASQVLRLAETIQQIPAPTFNESERAQFVQKLFRENGLEDVAIDAVGNVYGKIPGVGDALPLVVSAHLDTVFPYETDLTIKHESERIRAPGIGDNSLGVAGLIGVLWLLKERKHLISEVVASAEFVHSDLPGDLWLVANVGEEGLGNLRGMRAVVERFSGGVLGYLVLEGMAQGQIFHRGLGIKRYRIAIHTGGGHSWVDYGKASAVHELGELIVRLTNIELPRNPRTTLNVGVISGGTSINTIASDAFLELDLRSEDPSALNRLIEDVEIICQGLRRNSVKIDKVIIGERPAGGIPQVHPFVETARSSIEKKGINPNLTIGSTDANIPLSLGYPAVCTGITKGGGAHTIKEYILTQPVHTGLEIIGDIIEGVYREAEAIRMWR